MCSPARFGGDVWAQDSPMTSHSSSRSIDGHRLRFILSAGRTGTVFITDFLASTGASVRVVHEPWPARWEHVLGNFRNSTGFGSALLRKLFRWARRRALADLEDGERLVEINPLLCPLLDVVGDEVAPIHVLHLVRDPGSWATSIASFKASGWRRHFIDSTPFAKPFPVPRPAGWFKLSEVERELYRWNYCNEQILSLAPKAAQYTCLRYEDLFSSDPVARREAFEKLLNGLGIEPTGAPAAPEISTRLNASRQEGDARSLARERVEEVCGPLMRLWGYART